MPAKPPKSVEGTIVKALTLDAPVERVYRAFTDRSDLEQWLAEPYPINVREGGTFQFGQKSDGHMTHGKFLKVEPNKKLVYTWGFTVFDPKTRKEVPMPGGDEATKVTITFAKAGKGTRVTIQHEGFPAGSPMYWPHEVGWEMLVGDILRKYLEVPRGHFDAWWDAEGEAWQKRFNATVGERAARAATK